MAARKENTPIPSTEPTIVQSESKKPRYNLKNRQAIAVLGIIIILLIAGLVIWHHSSQKTAKTTQVRIPAGITSTQKAQYLADQGQYSAAEQAWQDQLAGANTAQAKLSIYYQQSALAVRFKHYDDAKQYAEEARQLSPVSSTPYVALAQLAEAQGDKTAARQYWQEAIAKLDPNSLGYNLTKRDYQTSLDSLQ